MGRTNKRVDEFEILFDLQCFAEGSTSGASEAEGADTDGVYGSDTTYGQDEPTPAEDQEQEDNSGEETDEGTGDEAIGGGEDTAETILELKRKHGLMDIKDAERRFAKQIRAAKEYDSTRDLVDSLARRYGKDVHDVEGIRQAMADDDSYAKTYAARMGVTEELAHTLIAQQADAEAYRREKSERERAAMDARIAEEEAEVKKVYKGFSLEESMKAPKFKGLMDAGFSMLEAYEALNHKELARASVARAVKETEDRLAGSSSAKKPAPRPIEGASRGGAAGNMKIDFSRMTDEELDRWLANN